EWLRHRAVTRPAFSKPLQPSVFGECVSKLINVFHKLSDQNSVDVYSWMQRLTLDVLGHGIFSFDFGSLKDDDGGEYVKLWNSMISRIFNPFYFIFPLWAFVPTPYNLKTWDLCRKFRQLMLGIIDGRKIEKAAGKMKAESEKDLLDMMIEAASSSDDGKSNWSSEDVMVSLISDFDLKTF
ncbi:hypothetical protein HK096_002252, partial [Nowakowskiella sp. JEL0078]